MADGGLHSHLTTRSQLVMNGSAVRVPAWALKTAWLVQAPLLLAAMLIIGLATAPSPQAERLAGGAGRVTEPTAERVRRRRDAAG